jgi:hypothetical protein
MLRKRDVRAARRFRERLRARGFSSVEILEDFAEATALTRVAPEFHASARVVTPYWLRKVSWPSCSPQAQRDFYRRNRDRIRANQRRYYLAHKARVLAKNVRWQKTNRARVNAARRKWRAANVEKERARVAAWQRKNRARVNAARREKRARSSDCSTSSAQQAAA